VAQYELNAALTIYHQADGSLVAYGTELPVFIVAKDWPRLREKLREASDSIARYLDGLGEDAARAYLQERGIEVAGVEDSVSLPVLVGANPH